MFDRLRAFFGGGSGADSMPGDVDMISCEDALRVVHEFLDGELDASADAEVKQHFDMCQRCYPHLHLETAFRDAIRRASAGETAPAELKDRIAAMLAEARSED